MFCEICGNEIGEDDKVADVEIDLSKEELYSLIWCEKCVKSIVTICRGSDKV